MFVGDNLLYVEKGRSLLLVWTCCSSHPGMVLIFECISSCGFKMFFNTLLSPYTTTHPFKNVTVTFSQEYISSDIFY